MLQVSEKMLKPLTGYSNEEIELFSRRLCANIIIQALKDTVISSNKKSTFEIKNKALSYLKKKIPGDSFIIKDSEMLFNQVAKAAMEMYEKDPIEYEKFIRGKLFHNIETYTLNLKKNKED